MNPKDQLCFSTSFTFNSLEKWNWIPFKFHQVQFKYEWIYKKPRWIKCKCNWYKSDNNKNEMFTSKTAMLLEFKTKRFLQIVVVLKVSNEKKNWEKYNTSSSIAYTNRLAIRLVESIVLSREIVSDREREGRERNSERKWVCVTEKSRSHYVHYISDNQIVTVFQCNKQTHPSKKIMKTFERNGWIFCGIKTEWICWNFFQFSLFDWNNRISRNKNDDKKRI